MAAGCFVHVALNVFTNAKFGRFGTDWVNQTLTSRMSLTEVSRIFKADLGGTDLAQTILNAPGGLDAIVILTDNETWAGKQHAKVAWDTYRSHNPKAKLVIASTAANCYSVGDPLDPSVLQVVGFDASIFKVIDGFLNDGQPITESEAEAE
jgi:60 kDa SS-A/Ro ribonucleoprotein